MVEVELGAVHCTDASSLVSNTWWARSSLRLPDDDVAPSSLQAPAPELNIERLAGIRLSSFPFFRGHPLVQLVYCGPPGAANPTWTARSAACFS
jgi:hypothetical protein